MVMSMCLKVKVVARKMKTYLRQIGTLPLVMFLMIDPILIDLGLHQGSRPSLPVCVFDNCFKPLKCTDIMNLCKLFYWQVKNNALKFILSVTLLCVDCSI